MCSSLSSAGKFLLSCTSTLLLCTGATGQGTGSCQGWGTAVQGGLANLWGGSWGCPVPWHTSIQSLRSGVGVAGGISGEISSWCSVSPCLHGTAGSVLSWDFLHVLLTEAIKEISNQITWGWV